jgi:hypothetical protein
MILIHNTTERNLKSLAAKHYEMLKPIVENAIETHVPFKQVIYIRRNLKNILSGTPSEIYHISKSYKRFCIIHKTTINKGIKKAFSYRNFLTRKSYNIYDLAEGLQVNVCPYCNRQYTFTIETEFKRITRPEFDHFFSQRTHPLLSLSFYNLIPSCVICNSHLKGSMEFSINRNIHPYLNGFNEDLKFNYIPNSLRAACGLTDEFSVILEIRNTSELKARIENNCKAFRLQEIYQEHKDSIREIVRKHHVSGGRYLKILAQSLPNLFTSSEELYQMAFSNYYLDIDFHKRPLAKITKDIYEQLKFDTL